MSERKRTDFIIVHCSATRPNQDVGVKEIDKWHKGQGWKKVGYHYVIRRDGTVEVGREERMIGSHTFGFNRASVGICIVGGLNAQGKAVMNFTDKQLASLKGLIDNLLRRYPAAQVKGHRDFSEDADGDGIIEKWEWMKDCPCINITKWMNTGVAEFI